MNDFAWIRNIFKDEPLRPGLVTKVNLVIGVLLMGGPLLALTFVSGPVFPIPRDWMYAQIGVGFFLVLGGLLIRTAPSYSRPVVIIHGIIFCVLPFAYTAMMWHALRIFPAARPSGGRIRFGHAPGVLAICMAYGLKLVSDSLTAHSRSLQKRIVQIGFITGAALDAALIYLMFVGFIAMFK